jgi:tetratricopeptide (TPR) repeat protein
MEKAGPAANEDQWISSLYKKTRGDVNALLEHLEALSRGKGIMEAIWDLDENNRRLLKLLSFFESSATMEMLCKVSGYPAETLREMLKKLREEKLVGFLRSTKSGASRYKLLPRNRRLVRKSLQDEEIFYAFVKWWGDYISDWKDCVKDSANRENCPDLAAEHENVVGVLDQLWLCATSSWPDELRSDETLLRPFDDFPKIRGVERELAYKYIEMAKDSFIYFRYESRWHCYQRNVQRAYALACALGDLVKAATMTSKAIYTYSLKGHSSPERLDKAEKGCSLLRQVYKDGDLSPEDAEKICARDLRMRGVIAMRRSDYEKSRAHFQDALDCLKELERYHVSERYINKEVAGIHDFLARLTMKSEVDLDKALGYLNEAIQRSKVSADEEDLVTFKTNKAGLCVWAGDYRTADDILKEVLPKSKRLGYRDLLAEGLYFDAFVYQWKSQLSRSRSNIEKAYQNIALAIRRGEDALSIRKGSLRGEQGAEYFLNLCSTYLLLSGLYLYRYRSLSNADEDRKQSVEYLSEGGNLLEMRLALYERSTDIDLETQYCQACHRIMLGEEGFDDPEDLFGSALRIQPGLRYRASNDFRFQPPVASKRLWKFPTEEPVDEKPDAIGGMLDPS